MPAGVLRKRSVPAIRTRQLALFGFLGLWRHTPLTDPFLCALVMLVILSKLIGETNENSPYLSDFMLFGQGYMSHV